ncbi:hypothetical protein KSS87_002877 [Heliosperma pusillum]|nr:hypothetical protein KSS87_002877 [Heliosperma pusillum]
MTVNEPDQDVIRWGLDLLDVGPFLNSSYGCDCSQDGGIYHDPYMRSYNYDLACNAGYNYVDHDAVIAHTLQDDFSRFQVDDSAQSAHSEPHQFQDSADWLLPSSTSYCAVQEIAQGTGTVHSSSCSGPGERPNGGEGFSYLEFVDESAVDGELGKRLNQMVSVPHVPRINGEIPSMDDATSDHQRLLDRLQLYDLTELKVQGDGNCQFRALSDQFYRTPEHHEFVRQQVVSQLKAQPEFYEGYVPMEYGEYLKKMSKSTEWGDHVTLQAAADSYGVKIFLMTSFKETCYMEIIPKVQMSKRIILLSFWAEVHYNSIYPQGDRGFEMQICLHVKQNARRAGGHLEIIDLTRVPSEDVSGSWILWQGRLSDPDRDEYAIPWE